MRPRPRTLRARIRFTLRRDSPAREEFCVLFIEDLRSVQARRRQEKLAAMGRVSAGVAHEIRNPLAAISQANALLSEDATDPAQRQLTKMVADNVERLKRIVDDVMEVAPGQVHDVVPIDATAHVGALCSEWARANGVALGDRSVLQGRAAGRGARRGLRRRAPAPRSREPARQRAPPRERRARLGVAAARTRRRGGCARSACAATARRSRATSSRICSSRSSRREAAAPGSASTSAANCATLRCQHRLPAATGRTSACATSSSSRCGAARRARSTTGCTWPSTAACPICAPACDAASALGQSAHVRRAPTRRARAC